MSKKLIYCDSTLKNNVGHFANACRAIVKTAITSGYIVSVHGSSGVECGLKQELNITKTFQWGINPGISSDPIIGWLLDYYLERDQMKHDLSTIEDIGAGDLMFVNSCTAPKVAGILAWMTERTLGGAAIPDVFFETPLPPGIRQITQNQRKLEAFRLLSLKKRIYIASRLPNDSRKTTPFYSLLPLIH